MKITVHSIVKNEENYIWYSIMSVIDFVDEIVVWDTGSTDSTVEIIKQAQKQNQDKISFKEAGPVTPEGYSRLRQKMLEETKADWVVVVDGDEVWWQESIKNVTNWINRGNVDAIITPYFNVVGDIYHYQEEKAGRYSIDGRVGNLTIRAFKRNIPGLHVENPYGLEGYFDETGKPIQESPRVKREFINAPYLHFTHLRRSRKDGEVMGRRRKIKHELGISFPLDFYYPEVFFKPRPVPVSFAWRRMNSREYFLAFLETPFRKIKRKIIK